MSIGSIGGGFRGSCEGGVDALGSQRVALQIQRLGAGRRARSWTRRVFVDGDDDDPSSFQVSSSTLG